VLPPSGHGFGLRTPHYAELRERGTRSTWVEAITENFLGRGGRPAAVLERVRRDARVALHGVSLSIGGLDPLNEAYLTELAELRHRIDASWVSDHLCFGTFAGYHAHDLWPLPQTEEALQHVIERVVRVQERLGERILLENVSSYLEYRDSTLPEWQFVSEVAERADCYLLLDLNNVVVNAKNHGFSSTTYVESLPRERIRQLHLAGHTDLGTHAIDSHASVVPDVVWDLYRHVVRRFGALPTIVEWDEALPSLEELETECRKAADIEREVLNEARAG
jgi:hypothetical protein